MTVEELLAQPVVSVSREPEPWADAASNIFLIRGPAAQGTGATVLPEVLRLATNLFVAQSSSWQWAVDARGFVRSNSFSNKLLVMVDGRTVYSPLFSNVFWDSTSVFLPDLDRIEVISGPAGSTWGANAVNGVINIQTKSALETLGGLVTARMGNEESSFGVRYGAKLGDTGAIRFYFQGAQHDGTLSPAGADDDADKWKSTQGGMRADWGNAATGAFTVQGDFFTGRFDNLGMPETLSDNGNILARWSRDLSPDSSVWVRAYFDYSRRDDQSVLAETTRTTDIEFQHSIKFAPGQNLLWGANFRMMSDSMQTVGFAILPANLDFALGSVFAEHQARFAGDALQVTTGLRMEHNHFSGWEYEPNIRLAWRPAKQTIWIAASRATRIPSRLETGFYEPAQPPYIVVGGTDVVAETVDAYELGWRSRPAGNLSVTTTAFLQNYDHLRSVEPTTPVTFSNGVKGRSFGVEAFVDWDVTPWWRVRLGGFSMKQETWIIPGYHDLEDGQGESSYPSYQVQFRNSFQLGRRTALWTSLRRVGAVSANDSGGGVVPAYTELDASVTRKLRPDLELGVTGRNLLHASHPELGGLSVRREIPRTVEATLQYKF